MAKPLKVAYVAMRYPVKSETFATNDVAGLSALGVDLTVLALRQSQDQEELLRQRSVEHVPLIRTPALVRLGWQQFLLRPVQWLGALFWLIGLNLAEPKALLKSVWLFPASVGAAVWAANNSCDVVHLRWGHYPALVGALLKRWAPAVKVSLSLSAYDLEANLPVTRYLAPISDAVRTLGAVNLPEIERLYGLRPQNVTVIYDGVPDSVLDISKHEKVPGLIVTASRLIKSKRVDDVVRSVAEVVKAGRSARLVVLGDGPEMTELRQLATQLDVASRVEFRGMVPYSDVIATMRRAEVFMMLSDKSSERLPNVVKEALATSCAVVVSHTPGIDELVTDGVSGLVVPPRDVAAASKALTRLVDSPEFRSSAAAVGRTHIQESFRLTDCAGKYVQLWTSLKGGADTRHSVAAPVHGHREGAR